MRGAFIAVVALIFVGYVGARAGNIYKQRGDLEGQVAHYLDFVDDKSIDWTKQKLVEEARGIGVTLTADNIHVGYEDTQEQTFAQGIVGGKLGTQFINKRATISVTYDAHLLGIPLHQEIHNSKIKQIQVHQPRATDPLMNQLLQGEQR